MLCRMCNEPAGLKLHADWAAVLAWIPQRLVAVLLRLAHAPFPPVLPFLTGVVHLASWLGGASLLLAVAADAVHALCQPIALRAPPLLLPTTTFQPGLLTWLLPDSEGVCSAPGDGRTTQRAVEAHCADVGSHSWHPQCSPRPARCR